MIPALDRQLQAVTQARAAEDWMPPDHAPSEPGHRGCKGLVGTLGRFTRHASPLA